MAVTSTAPDRCQTLGIKALRLMAAEAACIDTATSPPQGPRKAIHDQVTEAERHGATDHEPLNSHETIAEVPLTGLSWVL